ncbi:uncharacterized protein [Hemitrygon akajei]|uniref:uncharacterized protein isoform X5 n=1 Tax=Hemitrygon akajei TaxID=2704970 RepID=UPI003BF97A38
MRSTVCLAMDRAESGVIATTPPVTCNMEERLSQASSLGSGTHLSNVSGFSLGEAIVQQAKQGSELWPQLQSEAGTGEVTSATASSLLLGGTDCTQTLEEFPTMEEGTITITEELGSPHSEFGPFQTLQMFELQKSDLSPALALVATCSMEGNMSQSIHHSPLEFAPLRPAPDLSGVSHEGCPGAFRANSLLEPFVSAVSSGHVKGSPSSREEQTSQHGSDAWTLSQCPLKSPTPGSEATEDEDMSRTDSYIQDQHFMELPSLPLGRELYRVPFLDCGPLLAQGVPTHPLSEQLDLLGNSGMQTAGVHSNQSSGPPRLGTITHGTMTSEVDGWRDTDQQCSSAEDGQASPQPAQNQRDPEISYQHQPGVEAAQPSCPDGSHEPSSAGGPDASGSGNTTGTGLVTSITNTHTPNNGKDDTAIEVLPNRGSKEQESHMSPVVCPLSCTDSFITPTVAAPLCQSTPTSYPSGQGKRAVGHQPESSGPLDFLSAPCCEELESHSASWEPVQSSPGTKRSLLPLGYLEKARASNPVMPLSFDSLVLRGLRGVSPRQRAYSAIADSLNHMLAQSRGQDLGRSPKRNIAVAFGAGPKSVQTAGRIGRCSQAGTGSDSQDPASICKPDRSPCLPKDVGNCSVDSMASDSANSEGLQPGHSAAGLLQQDVLPDPSSSNGQEEDSLEQNSSLPEHRILSPFPEPLVADHTHQFETTFTDDGTNPQASSLDTSQAGEHTLTVSGHSLTSLEVDNYVPTWAPSSLTPEINHFNIDDRIPVYLRNLGINQSPTSILGSRGLLKEVEFNTSEQKILQEAGLGRFSVAEGGEETKRSAQTLDPLSMLDEEDRRKIEEIKAELLQKAKTSIGLQCAWSVTAKDSSLVSDPGWPACPLPTCLPLSSTRSRIHTQDWGPSDKQWNMDKLLGTLGAGSPPTPIAAITICSRRKPPSSSPSLSASLLMAPSDHEQFPAHLHEAKVSAIEPAQCLESVVGDEGQCPQEDRHIAKPITVRQDVAEAAEGLTDGDSISAPLRSPTRTVMSHIRVTLSPNRSRSPLSPSGKSLLLSGTQPSPPAQHPIPATASPSPPYPPLPMPMPVICPTFPSLVDHSPGATFPGTGQPQGQDSPETRTVTVQGSSKVDVSTQTSGLAFAPAAGSMLSQAAGQDVGVWSEGTPSVPAPVTGGTTDVSGHGLTTDVPLMLPYKPAGSSRLFYMPSSGARHRIGLMDSKNSGEISQADLNNVPPPGPQSQVLPPSGSHTALGKGTEHWNSRKTVASKVTRSKEGRDPRSHRSLHTQRAGGLENSPRQRAEGEGAQYRANRHPKERQRMAGSRHAPLQHAKREAWLEPCPLEGESGLSYKERAKAVVRSAWEQPVPGHRPRGSALDELWERFQERQQRHWSLNSSTASELSLLQRLDRLAQLLRDPRPLAAGRPRSPSTTSMAEISTDHVRFLHDPGSSSPRVPSTESATSGPSDSSSAASTIDTARLIRAFGPERVLPLDRLYGTIQRQREHPAPRRERPRKGETRYPGTRKVSTPQALTVSSSTSDSVAGRRGSAWPPHGPSSRLLSKKVTRLVDQGVQTGSLEIVPGATRRQTRDVGVTFPSPDPDVSLQRLTGPRDRRKGVSQTERKASKGHRTPAIAWYIPAHELQGDWRKENTNDQYRPVQAWAQRGLVPQPWREPLRQRHLQDQWVSKEARDTWPPPPSREDGVGGKFPSTLVPLTLREALTMNKPWFISHSQERVRRLALLVEERKLQSEFQSERDRLFNQPPSRGFREWRGQRPDYSILFKKKISKQEMLDRSKRLYEQLPEVVRRREEEKRKTEYRANRLKAQLYKQKITNRVLGKKVSWQ